VELETLISRDGLSVDQAVELVLHSSGSKFSRRELYAIARKLPLRPPRRPLPESELVQTEDPYETDRRLLEEERSDAIAKAWSVLKEAMYSLPEEDRLILRMHLIDGFTIAEIARFFGLKQKPLYNRVRRSTDRLRIALEKAGLARETIVALLA
jgi:DNA-directed RNA polymerase specialized sigma24 family protein